MRRPILEGLGAGRLTTASIVTFSHFYVAIATLVQSMVLARLLSLAEFGQLAAALAIAGLAEAAINARASETALAVFARSTAHNRAETESLTRQLLVLDLAWSAGAYLILLIATLIYDFVFGADPRLFYGLMLAGFISVPWGTAKGYITVHLSARKFAPVELSYVTTAFVIGLGLSYFLGSLGFVLGVLAASLVRTLVGLHMIGLNLKSAWFGARSLGQFDRKAIWSFGFTGTLRSFLINGLQQIDLLILAVLASPSSVGLYRAAKNLSSIPQRLGQPIWVLLKRHVIAGADQRRHRSSRDPVILASALLLALGVLAAPGLLLADQAMAFLFGPEYAPAGILLWRLLPAAWIMYGVGGWTSTFGSVSERRFWILSIYLVQLLTILVVLFIEGVDPTAMAMAVALAQVAASGAFWWLYLVRRRRRGRAGGLIDSLDDEDKGRSVELF